MISCSNSTRISVSTNRSITLNTILNISALSDTKVEVSSSLPPPNIEALFQSGFSFFSYLQLLYFKYNSLANPNIRHLKLSPLLHFHLSLTSSSMCKILHIIILRLCSPPHFPLIILSTTLPHHSIHMVLSEIEKTYFAVSLHLLLEPHLSSSTFGQLAHDKNLVCILGITQVQCISGSSGKFLDTPQAIGNTNLINHNQTRGSE